MRPNRKKSQKTDIEKEREIGICTAIDRETQKGR